MGTIPNGILDAMPTYGSYLDLRMNYMSCCGYGFQHDNTYSYVAYLVSGFIQTECPFGATMRLGALQAWDLILEE